MKYRSDVLSVWEGQRREHAVVKCLSEVKADWKSVEIRLDAIMHASQRAFKTEAWERKRVLQIHLTVTII